MNWADNPDKAAQDLAKLDDKAVGERAMASVAIAMLLKQPSTELIELMTTIVRDVRAGERLRVQTAEKGKAVADSLHGALHAEEKR